MFFSLRIINETLISALVIGSLAHYSQVQLNIKSVGRAFGVELYFRLELTWNQAAKGRVCVGLLVLCNQKKKEHLFWMEIQGFCWDKRALPQCGWDRMQGNHLVWLLFMQTHTICVSFECQRIHHVNIKARAEWNKMSDLSCMPCCNAVSCNALFL